MMIYFIAIAGVLFHLLMKFRDAYTKQEVFDYKRQLVLSAISGVIALVLVYFRIDICKLINLDVDFTQDVPRLLMFLIAYFADSVWKNVENTGRTTLKVEE